jgi:hypothetical protein
MTPNKPLVPTRNGEAPLLAAQRRRWALGDKKMKLMNGQQHRNWTVILAGLMVLSAAWAAWNRNLLSSVGSLGIGLALVLFYVARRSRYQQLMRWTAFACSIVSLGAMLFRSITLLLESSF